MRENNDFTEPYSNSARLSQSLGRVEGRVQGIDVRVTRIEDNMQKGFSDIRRQIEDLAGAENRRKGAMVVLASAVSAGVTYVIERFVRP